MLQFFFRRRRSDYNFVNIDMAGVEDVGTKTLTMANIDTGQEDDYKITSLSLANVDVASIEDPPP